MTNEHEEIQEKKDLYDKEQCNRIQEDLEFTSNNISTQTRTISLGILAVAWGLMIADTTITKEIWLENKKLLFGVFALSIFTLILDFFQNVVGYRLSKITLNRIEKRINYEEEVDCTYNNKSRLYRARIWLFWIKQCFLVANTLLIFTILYKSILKS